MVISWLAVWWISDIALFLVMLPFQADTDAAFSLHQSQGAILREAISLIFLYKPLKGLRFPFADRT